MKNSELLFCAIFLGAITFSAPVLAQPGRTEPIADKVRLAKLKAAVEVSIDSPKVHKAYVEAMGRENPNLEKQYIVWMTKYPKSAMVPYSMAKAFLDVESPKAKPYLLKAVAINPKFTAAWVGLWIDGLRWGDDATALNYLTKVVETDPYNASYAFSYAFSFKSIDEEKWRQMSLDVARRFPDQEGGAQALYWLGVLSKDKADKLKFLGLLHDSFAPEKFRWSSIGMSSYFDMLLSEDPEKALALAQEMVQKEKEEKKIWPDFVRYAQSISKVNVLLKEKKGAEAMVLLDSLKLPSYFQFNKTLPVLKAQANDVDGNTIAAYDSLIETFIKRPSLVVKEAILGYGVKLGKNAVQVDFDIWTSLNANAKIATPFTNLKRYLTPGTASLSDYKGKVVLLTYWFPGCSPCRNEFPHFENVVKKFKGQDLEYLGINIVSKQNEYVIPFMKASGYSFTPLEEVEGRIKGNLDNGGAAPVNFLIDKKGRLIFSNFRTDGENEDDLELMIKMLMEYKV